MTAALFLGMAGFFLVGILFSTTREEAAGPPAVGKRVEPPDILQHRVKDWGGEAAAGPLVAQRRNHSRDLVPSHQRKDYEQPDLPEEGRERNRRLQQKLDLKSKDEGERQPRRPDLPRELPQRSSEAAAVSEPQFKLPAKVVGEKVGGQGEADRRRLRGGEEGEEGGAEGRDPWKVWQSWVRQDYFYPDDAFWSDEMNSILHAMATYPIMSFDVGHRGTQLKASMFLGEQRTAFKPMRQVKVNPLHFAPHLCLVSVFPYW